MATHDHFRVDVLVRDPAKLHVAGIELVEIERLLHLDEAGATCPRTAMNDRPSIPA